MTAMTAADEAETTPNGYCQCIGSSYTSEQIDTTWLGSPDQEFTPGRASCNACGLPPMPNDRTRSPGALLGSPTDWRAIADSLAIDEPWSTSFEGLDDCCMFCGAEDRRYVDYRTVCSIDDGGPHPGQGDHHHYIHNPACPWIAARKALGYTDTSHTTASTPDE